MIHLEDHEYGSCITKRDQLNIITSVSSINIMQCVFMYIVYAFADLRKTTVRCQPGPTVLHINCRLTVNKQDMTSQKFPIHYLWWVILVLRYYAQLLVYISHEQSNLPMLVTTKACSNCKGSGQCEQTIWTKVSLLVADGW